MPESTQHKLDRIRPPRVQITYDVETRGSFVKTELPFVVGILADLSGNDPDSVRTPLRDRKYVEIDRDNFNDVMKKIGPKAKVNGKILSFENIDGFNPINVLRQIEAHGQYQKRTALADMASKLDGNVKLQKNLREHLLDSGKLTDLKKTVEVIKALVAPPQTEATKPEEAAKTEGSPETPKDEGGKS